MQIVADEGISLLGEDFAQWGELTRLPGRDIARADLSSADALLVRSITAVDSALLTGTNVRFVGSTTSGVDHIDQRFLRASNIAFAHATGCNAEAVADYVCSALAALGVNLGQAASLQVGVIGLGQVGSRVAGRLHGLGFKIKAYDPFLELCSNRFLTTRDEALGSDILSLHVPLTCDGDYPTRHMFDTAQLAELREQLILINAARGAVIDNEALSDILPRRPAWQTVLDVWEGEPEPNQTLLQQVNIATPHIAGHSAEAKIRGSKMVYQSFLKHFFGEEVAANECAAVETGVADATPFVTLTEHSGLNEVVLEAYDVRDDARLLTALAANNANIGEEFERLRKHYRVRHEFSACRLNGVKILDLNLIKGLKCLNFNV
ncbi:MAG: 4-phosphoerythronate dehydrogenase [Pseudomonadales bacterium]